MTETPSVCIVGPGIVGQATGKVFISKGVRVAFLGIIKDQIGKLRNEGYDAFTADEISNDSYDFDITMFTVPTLTVNGRIDLSALELASIDLGKRLKHQQKYHLVVVKSTVLPGTTEDLVIPVVEKYSGKKVGKDFGACMNPEYLRQETSYDDTLNPWMILVGEYDKKSGDTMDSVYKGRFNCPLFRCSIKEAEMQKYVHNIYNAVKITYFNEMRQIAKSIGANAEEIFKYSAISCEGMWNPSYGIKDKGPFDGACLPKDTQALLYWAQTRGFEAPLLETAIGVNNKLAANSGIRKFNLKSEELL